MIPPAALREIALRWGYDPDHLTPEQVEEIEDAVRCWSE